MKKLPVLVFLFLSLSTLAQEDISLKYHFGVNSGLNLSTAYIDTTMRGLLYISSDQLLRYDYNGGLSFIYHSDEHLGVQLELNYTRKGWTEMTGSGSSFTRKLDYIELPLLSHFALGSKKGRFIISIGPSFSYLLASRGPIGSLTKVDLRRYYVEEIDNKLEISLCLGAGFSRVTEKGILQLECRLNQGITNMFDADNGMGIRVSQNQVIQLKLSYLIEGSF